MYNNQNDTYVQCPYYQRETPQVIYCEGVQDKTALRLGFANKGDWKKYKDCRCRDNWKDCLIAKMLNLKYDYEI